MDLGLEHGLEHSDSGVAGCHGLRSSLGGSRRVEGPSLQRKGGRLLVAQYRQAGDSELGLPFDHRRPDVSCRVLVGDEQHDHAHFVPPVKRRLVAGTADAKGWSSCRSSGNSLIPTSAEDVGESVGEFGPVPCPALREDVRDVPFHGLA